MRIIIALLMRVWLWLKSFVLGLTMWQIVGIALLIAISGVIYYLYSTPALAAMMKNFFVKTIPLLWKKFILRRLPGMIARALAKSWVKKIVIWIFIIILGKRGRDKFEEFSANIKLYTRKYLIVHPKAWWGRKSKIGKVLWISFAIGIVALLFGFRYLGVLVLAIDFIVELLFRGSIYLSKLLMAMLPKVGLGKLVVILQDKFFGFIWSHIPASIRSSENFQKIEHDWVMFYKWKLGRKIVAGRCHLKDKSSKLISSKTGKDKLILKKDVSTSDVEESA